MATNIGITFPKQFRRAFLDFVIGNIIPALFDVLWYSAFKHVVR